MFKSFPDAVPDLMISFGFGNNSTRLELIMDSEQNYPTTGWELIPHARPLIVRMIMIHNLVLIQLDPCFNYYLKHGYYPLPTHSVYEGYCSRRVS